MSTERYTTILGEVIEYPAPSSEVAAFLERVKRAAHDPSVSEAQLSELVYGRENPVLDQTIFPGRGAVTKAVHANPVWPVMQDLLDAMQLSKSSPAKIRTRANGVRRIQIPAESMRPKAARTDGVFREDFCCSDVTSCIRSVLINVKIAITQVRYNGKRRVIS